MDTTAADPRVALAAAQRARRRARWRRSVIWVLPGAVTATWAGYVAVGDLWGRVADHWRAGLTMTFGSFVAGSTPQGGGAVAFPVFTKVLDVPADVARTFSLSIQAVGMVTAALVIVVARRPIDRRSVLVGGSAGMVGFLGGLVLLGDPSDPFWASRLPSGYVKVTFTVVLAAMAYVVYLSLRAADRGTSAVRGWNSRVTVGLVLAGLMGGLASAFTGSGVDVLVFLFIVVLAGLHPRVGVPTSIVAMAMISTVGIVVLGLWHGQLDVTVDGSGDVVSVGGDTVGRLAGQQFDVYGLWLASIPIVVWGAPLGSWVAHVIHENGLIILVAGMAATEVVSTAIFLDELHHDPALLAYAVTGVVASLLAVRALSRHRHRLLQLPIGDLDA